MTTSPITYVSAKDGGLEFTTASEKKFWSKDLADLIKFAKKNSFDGLMGSSSMDFASEYGFDTDQGANQLLNKVTKAVLNYEVA